MYQLYRHLYRSAGANEAYFSLDPAACAMGTADADMKLSELQYSRALRSQAAKKAEYYRAVKKSDDPNLIYGRDFEGETIELSQVLGEMGEIIFRGKVISAETKEIRNEKTIYMFAVTDFTDSIMVKMFLILTRMKFIPLSCQKVTTGKMFAMYPKM